MAFGALTLELRTAMGNKLADPPKTAECYLAAWRMGRGAWFINRRCSFTEPAPGTGVCQPL